MGLNISLNNLFSLIISEESIENDDQDDLDDLELKISILSQDDSAELAEIIAALTEMKEKKLQEQKERLEGASKVIRNKRQYIRNMFNEEINRIISQRLSNVQVKIADLGNACFDVSIK